MSTQWTLAQRDAIDARGGTVLVSAAAGSGKTAVLVERAVRLLTDETAPVQADRLLIATFTRAAAEELRARIAVRLAAELAENPDSAWLRKQRLLLGRANICTVDAYCMQLLQRYFAELDLPPDFTLADDALAHTLRQAALAETLEEMYDDADFCAFASLYGRARSDAGAGEALLALYDFLRSLPHPAAALCKMCERYETRAPLVQTDWGAYLLAYACQSVQSALMQLRAARAVVAAQQAIAAYDAALTEDMAFFEALLALLHAARWDDALRYLEGFQPAKLKAVRGFDGVEADEVKALRQAAKDTLGALKKHVFVCSEAEFDDDRARLAPMLRALARAVTLFEQRFFAAKLEEKSLEYSDFEHLALRLLCGEKADGTETKTDIAHTVSRGFDVVMVDEYQDTNALQALLYRCLANDDASNLFFVGDVKQSIYRFRLASPEIFIEKRRSFAPYRSGGPLPATVVLGHNFRSAGSVIAQINDVFACLMSETLGNVIYDASEALVQGTSDDYDGGPMELKLVDTSAALQDAQEESDGETRADDVGDAEAVAETIARMVAEGFAVREKGGTRPCKWDDFCILLRGRARFVQYAGALGRRGVPVYADTGESWLTSPEVSPVLSLLRVIDNPGQEVHLAAALLSPLFRFTPDDLTCLRANAPHERLYAALLQSGNEKCRSFCETLRILRALAVTLPVDALCTEIFTRTYYFAAIGAMENGAARRENLRSFSAFAAGASASATGGLSGFLRRVDSAIESGSAQMGGAPPPPKGTVAIMTIHRSKGLEFPVCILADAAHGFNRMDARRAFLFHPVLGAGFNLRADAAGEGGSLYATAPHRAIRLAELSEGVSEEMRILYVALTRAKDKLIVTFPHANPNKLLRDLAVGLAGTGGAHPFTLAQQDCFAKWLCAFALLHPDCDALRKAAGGIVLPLRETTGHLHAEIVPALPALESGTLQEDGRAETAGGAFQRKAAPDDALLAALLKNFAAHTNQNPDAALSTLPAKLSVSAISHDTAQPVLARPAFLYKEGLTAAERGTAQHAFLQFANLAAAGRNLPAELDRLVQEGYLTDTLAEKLPQDRIRVFLQSSLAARMLNADVLLREYDFITAVEAQFVAEVDERHAFVPVLVQGIADAVLLRTENGEKTIEIVDYKTDKSKTPQQFVETYAKQLDLYRRAMEKRLGARVTKCTIYAFALSREIDVPLDFLELDILE